MSGRATRATSAVDRLKVRTGNAKYSMSRTGSGHFFDQPHLRRDHAKGGAAR